MSRPSPQQIKQLIRESISDRAAADTIIAQLRDDELERGELRFTEDMLNNALRDVMLKSVPNGMLKDYRVTLRDGALGLTLKGNAMKIPFTAAYTVRFTGFSFAKSKGHRIQGRYDEKISGVPRFAYASHGSLLRFLVVQSKSGLNVTADSFDISLDTIPAFTNWLSAHPLFDDCTVRMGRIADGTLPFRFD